MPRIPVPLSAYTNSGRGASNGSRLVNLFANVDPNDPAEYKLFGTPGTSVFATLPTFPILAMIEMDDAFYVVTATHLYQVEWYGTYTDLGSVSLSGERVSIATNGTHLVFVDGLVGYSYSVAGGIAQFSGDGWYPANTVTYDDGYFVFNRAGTGQFFITELLDVTIDPTMWATAEAAPDDTLCVISNQRILFLLGAQSGEMWYDAGDPLFPYQRISGAFIEVGITSPYTAAKADNSVFWLGSDGIVYRTNGYNALKVSTPAIEYALNTPLINDAFAYTYTEEGHMFYVLTVPSKRLTFVYDITMKLWHERSHFHFGRHVSNCFCRITKYGLNLVGDFQNGNIYTMSMDAYSDDGTAIKREVVLKQLDAGVPGATMYSAEIEMEHTGPNIESPTVTLQWSDDGKRTWSKERVKPIGAAGEFNRRAKWGPLGFFQRRNLKFTITDQIPVVINGVFAEYD
jgi:hypothetical protein